MQIKVSVSGVETEFKRLLNLATGSINEQSRKIGMSMVEDLRNETPVDTGNARDAWRLEPPISKEVIIKNDVPYIEHLNAGSSKQAPAFFVEAVALKYGTPKGVMVTTIKS